jgi:hypothetical protein
VHSVNPLPHNEATRSPFVEMYDATADSMRAEFNRLRASLTHSGARGDAAEEIVRQFLIEALPTSLGVAVGQVVDARGNFSGESDVIIYNAARTPMLFRSAQGGRQTVPIEGVVAVIEVKSRLQKKDLTQFVTHARTLKSLERHAYMPQTIAPRYHLYEREWSHFPVLYSVFAFASDGLYVTELNQMQADTPLHQRIDNLCALDRGLAVNVCLTGTVDNPETLFSLQPTATRLSKLGEVATENPLLPWFALNASLFVQADCPPINLGVYVADRLRMDATMPSGNEAEFRNELYRQMSDKIGVSVEVLAKVGGTSPGPFAPSEVLELVEPYQRGLFTPGTPEAKQIFQALAQVSPNEREAVLLRMLGTAGF